jgi:small subunit ribosomal protein S16
MLAIRLQRLGRKQYPVYRVAIQEAQRHPSSGRVVAYVGSYNPHTKKASFDKEKVEKYLSHGAQPSPRVIRLLDDQKITVPSWVKRASGKQERTTRHPEKLRKNQSLEETSVEPEAEETQNDAEKKPVETLEEESVEEKTKKTEVTDKEEK